MVENESIEREIHPMRIENQFDVAITILEADMLLSRRESLVLRKSCCFWKARIVEAPTKVSPMKLKSGPLVFDSTLAVSLIEPIDLL